MQALRSIAIAALVFLALAAGADRVVLANLRVPSRLDANFSPAMLRFEIARLRDRPPQTIVLGDSVLWGYRLRPEQTAVARLNARGISAIDLAYEGGSPVNSYAVLEALLDAGVRPRRVIFNVNQKVFNAADSAYATIEPSVMPLVRSRLLPDDAALLTHVPSDDFETRLDASVSQYWQLYAMRDDVREALFGDVDAAHALHASLEGFTGAAARDARRRRPTAQAFEGTYDLAPLDEANVSVHFLKRLADRLASLNVPALAILTPTNHTLLADDIDTPAYDRNLNYVSTLLERRGIRVTNIDRAFGPSDFIDNDHLTAAANDRLARYVARELAAR